MDATKSSISYHLLCSEASLAVPVCALKVTHDHKASNRLRERLVRWPSAGAARYLLRARLAHRSARAPNWNRVPDRMTSMNLRSSFADVGRIQKSCALREVRHLNCFCVHLDTIRQAQVLSFGPSAPGRGRGGMSRSSLQRKRREKGWGGRGGRTRRNGLVAGAGGFGHGWEGGNLPKKESRQNSQVWKWERKCGHRNGYDL